MNTHLFRYDQAASPFGSLKVIVNMAVTDLVIFAEVGQVRGKTNPIGHDGRTNLQWRKEKSEFRHSDSLL
jgi:hypothetical protein